MKGLLKVSNAELEVMEMLWKQGGSIKQPDLLALFEESGKTWKRQTLNTFLTRLEDKGLVHRDNKIVKPLYSREEYRFTQMKAAIDSLYDGQLCGVVTEFSRKNAITEKEAGELISILSDI